MNLTTKETMNLTTKAESFERDVEEHLVNDRGWLRSALDIHTMKPFPQGYFTAEMDMIRHEGADIGDYSELIEYENNGMVSGAYLCSLLYKYAVTKQPDALDKAYRTFYGIKDVYDMSAGVEPGYFCTPSGGKRSLETSSDQYIYVLTALDKFVKVAKKAERDMAVEMIIQMSRYWKDRDYTRDYFGMPLKWPLNRFTGFAWLNYVYSGDAEMFAEFKRLAALREVRDSLPFAGLDLEQVAQDYNNREKLYIEDKFGKIYMGGTAEGAQSGMLSIESCLEHNAPF
jgi:hypothetical protein